jgi:Flp pilus assembly protein CpaB
MNQKLMFFISIIVIVVGVSGIVLNNKEEPAPIPSETVEKKTSTDTAVKLLVANKALTPGAMLKADDYSVKLIDVAVDSEWTKYHATKKVGDYLGGYITAPVAQGEYILPELLITPGHPEFMKMSLGQDVAYNLDVRLQDHDMIALISPMDKVDIYLLTKGELTKVISGVTVLKKTINKEKKEAKLLVRLTLQQSKDIKVVESEGAVIPMLSSNSTRSVKSGDVVSDFKKYQIDKIKKLKG